MAKRKWQKTPVTHLSNGEFLAASLKLRAQREAEFEDERKKRAYIEVKKAFGTRI
jgi:hypothetical protein